MQIIVYSDYKFSHCGDILPVSQQWKKVDTAFVLYSCVLDSVWNCYPLGRNHSLGVPRPDWKGTLVLLGPKEGGGGFDLHHTLSAALSLERCSPRTSDSQGAVG